MMMIKSRTLHRPVHVTRSVVVWNMARLLICYWQQNIYRSVYILLRTMLLLGGGGGIEGSILCRRAACVQVQVSVTTIRSFLSP
jgi:hypothetical protein